MNAYVIVVEDGPEMEARLAEVVAEIKQQRALKRESPNCLGQGWDFERFECKAAAIGSFLEALRS